MKKRKRFHLSGISLKSQLVFSFLAITLLVLSISMYYSYIKTLSIVEKKTQETTLAEFHQIEANILTLLHEVDNMSNTFLYESEILTVLESDRLSNSDFLLIERDITTGLIPKYFSFFEYLDSIYIFTENGMIVGGTKTQNQSSTVLGKDYPFYNTELYQTVKDHHPKSVWIGGLRTSDFMRIPVAHNLPNTNLISMIRAYKPSGKNEVTAELVLNLNERYLHELYGNLQISPKGSISIVDDTGIVFSSTLEESIGKNYLFEEEISNQNGFSSFSAIRDGEEEQVFYYQMEETGWVLVNEVLTELYLNDYRSIQRFSAIVFVLSVMLIVAISYLWVNRIMKSLQQLINGMRTVGSGNLGLTLPRASNKEIGHLITQFNKMSTGIVDLMKKNEEAEEEKRRLEIEALQAHINPHFLFNTLNTMKWMATVAGARNIVDCMTNLGNMLRPIYYQPALLWSIEEEVKFAQNYINIMNYRYGDEMNFDFEVPDELLKCQTLRFIIQPLIENTLTHGNKSNSDVQIHIIESDGDIIVTVTDTKGGMPHEQVKELNNKLHLLPDDNQSESKGIGLENVNKRIRLHFGERYGIEVESAEGIGTTVMIRIPMLNS